MDSARTLPAQEFSLTTAAFDTLKVTLQRPLIGCRLGQLSCWRVQSSTIVPKLNNSCILKPVPRFQTCEGGPSRVSEAAMWVAAYRWISGTTFAAPQDSGSYDRSECNATVLTVVRTASCNKRVKRNKVSQYSFFNICYSASL